MTACLRLRIVVVVCTVVASPALATPILDQSNITFLTFDGDGAPGSAVIPDQTVAQTFSVGISGVLTQIDLGIYRDADAIGDVTLNLLPASIFPSFDLSPSLLSATIPIMSIPLLTTTLTSVDVSSANLAVHLGDQLAVVLSRSVGSPDSPPWVVWQDSDFLFPYEGGSFFVAHPFIPGWIPVSGDHRFQTWVDPTLVPEPSTLLLLATGLLGFRRQIRKMGKRAGIRRCPLVC
jgi:hypothetical protein